MRHKLLILCLTIMISIVIVILLVYPRLTPTKNPFVSLKDTTQDYQQTLIPTDKDIIRVAVASITSTQESIVYYEDLFRFLEKQTGRTLQLVLRKTYGEVNALLKSKAVDIAFICTYSYVLAKEENSVELLVAPKVNGNMVYYSYIIVRDDSGIETFDQLERTRFAFTDPISNSGHLYALYALKKIGQTPESFFAKTTFTYSHDNSILAVAERVVDGAAVDSLVYYYMLEHHPNTVKGLRIIDVSQPFGIQPVVVRPGLDQELKGKLRDIFLDLHTHEEGQTILKNLQFEAFQLQEDSAYDGIREMARLVL